MAQQKAKQVGAAEFKAHCLQYLDELPPEGLIVTKRGKAVARLTPIRARTLDLFGALQGKIEVRGDIVDTSDLPDVSWPENDENLPRKRRTKR